MPSNLVSFPTHVGVIRIEFAYVGPLATWEGPAVFFTLDHTPVVSIVMRSGEAAIDVLGTDPAVFEDLPQEIQDGAKWWAAMLKLIDGAWASFVHANAIDQRDAA